MPDTQPAPGITAEQLSTLADKLRDGDAAMETRVAGVATSVETVASDVAELRTGQASLVSAIEALTAKLNETPTRSTQTHTQGDGGPAPKADAEPVVNDDEIEKSPLVIALRSGWETYDKGAVKASNQELAVALRSLVVAGAEIGHFVEPTKKGR